MKVNDFWTLMGSIVIVALVTSILIRGTAATNVITAASRGFAGVLGTSMGSTANGGYQV